MPGFVQDIVQVVGVAMGLSGIMLMVSFAVRGYRDSKRAGDDD